MADNTSDALLASIGSPEERPTKRPKVTKVTRACDRCKSRKRRCDGELPCSVCLGAEAACAYNATYTRGKLVGPRASQGVEDRTIGSGSTAVRPQLGPGSDFDPAPDHPAPRGDVSTATGFPGPRGSLNGPPAVAEELAAEGGQYAGPSSAYAFLKRAWERFGKKQAHERPEVDGRQQGTSHSTSVFSFGDKQWPKITPMPRLELPSHTESAALLSTYFDFAMPTYRFLHRPTVEAWSHDMEMVSPARQATVWMVLATASLFDAAAGHTSSDSEELRQKGERCYQAAQSKLAEDGRLQVEVVQARLAICLYLLHTSRPNEAWYAFGTTVQMMFALGLHRRDREKGVGTPERVVQECRKRTFWAISTLDIYLSVMLGRPPLIHDEDVDQRFPAEIDDAQLVSGMGQIDMESGDKIVTASILHAKIARIVRNAAREQVTAAHKSDQGRVDVATRSNDELAVWQASLPVLLSGAVSPSSLIPVFRRQILVLRLAHAHALMLVNRGLLLTEACERRSHVHCLACINAARTTLDMLTNSAAEGTAFSAFWFTQYVTFNAVSIVYVWLIQRTRGRLAWIETSFEDQKLFEKAEAVQTHFAEATHMNAPSLRYNIVLEELQQEAGRLMAIADRAERAEDAGDPSAMVMGIETLPNGEEKMESVALASEMPLLMERDDFATDETLYANVPLDPDLWLQLDSFPFSDAGLGLGDWVSSG